MKETQVPRPSLVIRSLELQIQKHRRKIFRLQIQKEILAIVFRVQPRDDRGRFLPSRREVK